MGIRGLLIGGCIGMGISQLMGFPLNAQTLLLFLTCCSFLAKGKI